MLNHLVLEKLYTLIAVVMQQHMSKLHQISHNAYLVLPFDLYKYVVSLDKISQTNHVDMQICCALILPRSLTWCSIL